MSSKNSVKVFNAKLVAPIGQLCLLLVAGKQTIKLTGSVNNAPISSVLNQSIKKEGFASEEK